MSRPRRLALLLVAFVALAAVLSACAVVKPGSFSASQPAGIGAVRLHLVLCTEGESNPCEADFFGGQTQSMLAFAVPKGSSAPATITAVPGPGASAITFSRNQEVGEKFAQIPAEEGQPQWPPSGSEVIGYLSDAFSNAKGANLQWTVDAEFGLPSAADGGTFGGPFVAALASGARFVSEAFPASRPIKCPNETPEDEEFCEINEQVQTGVSDLRIAAPAP